MSRTPLSQLPIFAFIAAFLFVSTAFAQVKPAVEVDVTKCWSYPTGDMTGLTLASDGSRAFLGFGGAKVEALSIDGKRMWASEFGGEIVSNILPLETGVYLVTSSRAAGTAGKPGEATLRVMSKETGITGWALKLPEAEQYFLGHFADSLIVVSRTGIVRSIDAKNGTLKWKREIAERFAAEPVFGTDKLTVAAISKQVFTISLGSGEIDSVRKFPYAITAIGVTTRGELIAGDERGNVLSLAAGTDKTNWKFKSGGEISSIVPVGDHLLVTSHDNFIYFLHARNGSRPWKKRLPGRVAHFEAFSDSYALISSFEEHGAVLTELSGGKVAGQVAFTEEEVIMYRPIVASSLILVLTNQHAYAYSLNGCPANKEGGNGQISPSPPL